MSIISKDYIEERARTAAREAINHISRPKNPYAEGHPAHEHWKEVFDAEMNAHHAVVAPLLRAHHAYAARLTLDMGLLRLGVGAIPGGAQKDETRAAATERASNQFNIRGTE